eukprot:scaffold78966_cov60-Phaeocystis_antarctica.AAC.2
MARLVRSVVPPHAKGLLQDDVGLVELVEELRHQLLGPVHSRAVVLHLVQAAAHLRHLLRLRAHLHELAQYLGPVLDGGVELGRAGRLRAGRLEQRAHHQARQLDVGRVGLDPLPNPLHNRAVRLGRRRAEGLQQVGLDLGELRVDHHVCGRFAADVAAWWQRAPRQRVRGRALIRLRRRCVLPDEGCDGLTLAAAGCDGLTVLVEPCRVGLELGALQRCEAVCVEQLSVGLGLQQGLHACPLTFGSSPHQGGGAAEVQQVRVGRVLQQDAQGGNVAAVRSIDERGDAFAGLQVDARASLQQYLHQLLLVVGCRGVQQGEG